MPRDDWAKARINDRCRKIASQKSYGQMIARENARHDRAEARKAAASKQQEVAKEPEAPKTKFIGSTDSEITYEERCQLLAEYRAKHDLDWTRPIA